MLDEQAISPRWSMKTGAGENIILHICVSPSCHPALGGVAALQLVTAMAPSCRGSHLKPPPALALLGVGRHSRQTSDGEGVIVAQGHRAGAASPAVGPCGATPAAVPPPLPCWAAWTLVAQAAARCDAAHVAAKPPLPQLSLLSCRPGVTRTGSKWIFYLFILG